MKFLRLIPAACLLLSAVACEENSTIGSSIIQDKVDIIIDSTFTITGYSVANPVIQSRTDNQLLGNIDAKGFGKLSSDFITQFMPATSLDTVGVTVESIDSIKLRMFMNEGALIGDSIIPMGLEVYKLNRGLPSPIYSDFDPSSYYSEQDKVASATYSATVIGLPDSIAGIYAGAKARVVDVKLPKEMGREFYLKYKSDPELYNDPVKFSQWFPGLYIKNSFGSGRVMRFYSTLMYLYYKKDTKVNDKDTTINSLKAFLAVTPEVINNNNINMALSQEVKTMAASSPMLVAPTGYDVEVNLPIRAMVEKYRKQANSFTVINSMTLEVPVEEVTNNYEIAPPAYALLVRKDKKDEFFADQQINDNISSFYAAYDPAKKSYNFSAMRQYFLEMSKKENVTAADGEFVIVPVSLVTESTQTGYYQYETVVVAIVPYVDTPAMAKVNVDKAKIKLTFSRQTM